MAVLTFLLCFTGIAFAGAIPAGKNADNSLNFLVMADWGGQDGNPFTTPDEVSVAKQMGIIGSQISPSFVLALGDNFYDAGVKSADDPRFQETFENVFTAPSLDIPFYVIAGNHDHHGNVSGEIAYSAKSKRWNFPATHYKLNFTIPGTNSTIVFLMIDTVLLTGDSYDESSSPPNGPADVALAELQWVWIEETLKATQNADYVFVAGHYPVWSIAEHGPTEGLVYLLRPMLNKYKVSAYLCGHEHNLQYIHEEGSGVEYLVIGAAHSVDTSTKHAANVPADWVKFHYADAASMGGFAYFEGNTKSITVTFATGVGKDVYQMNIYPRQK